MSWKHALSMKKKLQMKLKESLLWEEGLRKEGIKIMITEYENVKTETHNCG